MPGLGPHPAEPLALGSWVLVTDPLSMEGCCAWAGQTCVVQVRGTHRWEDRTAFSVESRPAPVPTAACCHPSLGIALEGHSALQAPGSPVCQLIFQVSPRRSPSSRSGRQAWEFHRLRLWRKCFSRPGHLWHGAAQPRGFQDPASRGPPLTPVPAPEPSGSVSSRPQQAGPARATWTARPARTRPGHDPAPRPAPPPEPRETSPLGRRPHG